MHELKHLYPLVVESGIVVIDDYGDWAGAKEATDEYFARHSADRVMLHRIDCTGRIFTKPSGIGHTGIG